MYVTKPKTLKHINLLDKLKIIAAYDSGNQHIAKRKLQEIYQTNKEVSDSKLKEIVDKLK